MPSIKVTPVKSDEYLLVEVELSDYTRLEQFCTCVETVMKRPHAKGAPMIRRMLPHAEPGGSRIELDHYDVDHMLAFLLTIRPLILENERFSFSKTQKVLKKYVYNGELKEWHKSLVRQYQAGDLSQYLQVSVGEIPLFSEKAFQIWLNGKFFHQHPEERAKLDVLRGGFGEEDAEKIFVNHLSQKWFACLRLYGAIGKSIRLPDS